MNAATAPLMTLAIALVCSAAFAQQPSRLDRYNLLQFRDASGNVQPVRTPADWRMRRAEILRGMAEVVGQMPGEERRVALEATVVEEADAGAYVRQLITYQSEPESRTPAYLCVPHDVLAGKRKAPAVLCLHPTDNVVGHQVVLGLGGREGRQYAAELAERGYVTLAPSYLDYYDGVERVWYFGQGWCQTRYMPRLSNYRGKLAEIPFDFPELLGALAPRPLYVNAPLHDGNFRWKSVDRSAAAARPVYTLLGGETNLVVKHPDCNHDFPDQQRREAYETIDSVLKHE